MIWRAEKTREPMTVPDLEDVSYINEYDEGTPTNIATRCLCRGSTKTL